MEIEIVFLSGVDFLWLTDKRKPLPLREAASFLQSRKMHISFTEKNLGSKKVREREGELAHMEAGPGMEAGSGLSRSGEFDLTFGSGWKELPRQVDGLNLACFTLGEKKIFKQASFYLLGRALLWRELVKILLPLKKDLTTLFLQKLLLFLGGEIMPAIKIEKSLFKKEITCRRCLSKAREILPLDYCPRCQGECFLCKGCLKMGEVRACTPLVLFPGGETSYAYFGEREIKGEDNKRNQRGTKRGINLDAKVEKAHINSLPRLDFELTKAQEDAYLQAKTFVEGPLQKALVFSLCGGGKTEAVFGAITNTLKYRKRVLFATPRRDITRELHHRLEKAFPGVGIKAFYGGHKNKSSRADIIICTTHQLFRFYRAFDLIILDEADAFPYRGSDNLPILLERALKKEGRLIYVTATPEKPILKEARGKKAQLITIPARFHRRPAPLPELLKLSPKGLEGEGGRFHSRLMDFMEKCFEEKSPLLVFVPTISKAEIIAGRIEKAFFKDTKGSKIEGSIRKKNISEKEVGERKVVRVDYSHSKDPLRDEKLMDFVRGELDILVATTILERGITIKKVKVLVLFSHDEIFDERALVQMAGRSGRTLQDPLGEVILAGEYITPAMKRARSLIKELNEEALKKGYIDRC